MVSFDYKWIGDLLTFSFVFCFTLEKGEHGGRKRNQKGGSVRANGDEQGGELKKMCVLKVEARHLRNNKICF